MQTSTGNAPFFIDLEVLVLNRQGIWLSDGIEITHEPTRMLFAKSLRKKTDGYYLEIGHERKKVQVEDTAYFVTRIDERAVGQSAGGFTILISDGTSEILAPETLSYQPPSRLTCIVQSGFGVGEEARFLSAPYFDLLKHLEENSRAYFLNIQGREWVLETKRPG